MGLYKFQKEVMRAFATFVAAKNYFKEEKHVKTI